MNRIASALDITLAVIVSVLMATMMLTVTADVTGRTLFKSPILGMTEFNRTLLAFVVFLGISYAQKKKEHFRVDLIMYKVSHKTGLILDLFALLCFLGVTVFIAYGAWPAALQALAVGEAETGSIRIPMWPGRFAIVIGCIVMSFRLLTDVVNDLRSLATPPEK